MFRDMFVMLFDFFLSKITFAIQSMKTSRGLINY